MIRSPVLFIFRHPLSFLKRFAPFFFLFFLLSLGKAFYVYRPLAFCMSFIVGFVYLAFVSHDVFSVAKKRSRPPFSKTFAFVSVCLGYFFTFAFFLFMVFLLFFYLPQTILVILCAGLFCFLFYLGCLYFIPFLFSRMLPKTPSFKDSFFFARTHINALFIRTTLVLSSCLALFFFLFFLMDYLAVVLFASDALSGISLDIYKAFLCLLASLLLFYLLGFFSAALSFFIKERLPRGGAFMQVLSSKAGLKEKS